MDDEEKALSTQQFFHLGKVHAAGQKTVLIQKFQRAQSSLFSRPVLDLQIEYETFPPKRPETGGMQSLKKLYRIGLGPSSSHTMGPRRAAERFAERHPNHKTFVVSLYGSLAATGKGHLTDIAIIGGLPSGSDVTIDWQKHETLPLHTNGMIFKAIGEKGEVLDSYTCYSVGGGSVVDEDSEGGPPGTKQGTIYDVYHVYTMNQILSWTREQGSPICALVFEIEGDSIREHLGACWDAMMESVDRGLATTGCLPGPLKYPRKAAATFRRAQRMKGPPSRQIAFAYALAVAEENGSGGRVVTAPTCGSCAVVPATLRYLMETNPFITRDDIIDALATAGVIGNIMKTNASISGATVGCQGEIGTGCAMAAGAAVQLLGGTPSQVEHAAEMAIEHHLGMTCDPVEGLVQVPCIERCAFATTRALDVADYALMGDGRHLVSYDEVVLTLKLTGEDIMVAYRETAGGGLAKTFALEEQIDADAKKEIEVLKKAVIQQRKNCATCGESLGCGESEDTKKDFF